MTDKTEVGRVTAGFVNLDATQLADMRLHRVKAGEVFLSAGLNAKSSLQSSGRTSEEHQQMWAVMQRSADLRQPIAKVVEVHVNTFRAAAEVFAGAAP